MWQADSNVTNRCFLINTTVFFLPSEITPDKQICKGEQSSHVFWVKETNNKIDAPPTTPESSDLHVREKRQTTLTNVTVTETRHPVTCVNWPGNSGYAYWKWDYKIPSTCHSESWKQYISVKPYFPHRSALHGKQDI